MLYGHKKRDTDLQCSKLSAEETLESLLLKERIRDANNVSPPRNK